MYKYEKPVMEVIYFDEGVRTDVVSGSNIEKGDNNVDAVYPF